MNTTNWKKTFFIIWSGQGISLLTSAVLQFAIIWYITDKTNSALMLSMASLAGFLPQGILGVFIGVLIDRYSRKLIMIWADILIALGAVALALFAVGGEIPTWVIMVVLFVRSVGTAFHTPALSATTPLLVPEEKLTKCAGYSQALQSVSYLASPALAALLYAFWDLSAIIGLDVLGALIACLSVAFVKIPKLQRSESEEKKSYWEEIKEGFTALKQAKGMMALLLVGALFVFFYMPINALFPLMSMSYFGGTAVEASIAETAFALGMLIGGVALGIWGGTKNKIATIALAIVLIGASLLVAGLLPVHGFIAFAICCGVMGLSGSLYSGVQTSLFQEKIAPEYLGRVFSLLGSFVMLAMPLGLILSGSLGDVVGVNNWFAISGVCLIAVALLNYIIPSLRTCDQKKT